LSQIIFSPQNRKVCTGLNDPLIQEQNFMAQMEDRLKGDDEAQVLDTNYIDALNHGLPPTAGMGIERLVMLLSNRNTIRDVIAFPTMKNI
jgi:lysyl-tRNA synthetase class 2